MPGLSSGFSRALVMAFSYYIVRNRDNSHLVAVGEQTAFCGLCFPERQVKSSPAYYLECETVDPFVRNVFDHAYRPCVCCRQAINGNC